MSTIILTTINAKYIHASLGLRYLLANMGALAAQTGMREYVLGQRATDIAEDLLNASPRIIGFGVYLWNVEETTRVIAQLKALRPDIVIVVGGPEVSFETADQAIVRLADYAITGQADLAFADFCHRVLAGDRPAASILPADRPALDKVNLPYAHYDDEDIAHRLIYVEAARGCPFKCEFCLSSLDATAWPYAAERFLAEMAILHERGARHFKFVDRTFNLNARASVRILQFFLSRLDDRLFLHFELIPDHLPDLLKAELARFPPGRVQLEIGIQTFNPQVQALISRRQDNDIAERNLRWLRRHTGVHLHVDLMAGLPAEDLASFGDGFDRLVGIAPHEIQIGILKRLRGTPIARHTQAHGMRYNPYPPYNVLSTAAMDFATLQRLGRFARYHDLTANSGRFAASCRLLYGDAPFERFLSFSDWLWVSTRRTHGIALDSLYDLVFEGLTKHLDVPAAAARAAIASDLETSGARTIPRCVGTASQTRRHSPRRPDNTARQGRHHNSRDRRDDGRTAVRDD